MATKRLLHTLQSFWSGSSSLIVVKCHTLETYFRDDLSSLYGLPLAYFYILQKRQVYYYVLQYNSILWWITIWQYCDVLCCWKIMSDFWMNFYSWINKFKHCYNQSKSDPWTSINFCHWITRLFISMDKLQRFWCKKNHSMQFLLVLLNRIFFGVKNCPDTFKKFL